MADTYFLLEYPIYRHFDADDVDILSKICTEEKFKAGADVFAEGSAGDAMYIIKSGSVKVLKSSDKGKKLGIILSPGEFFGEMALIDGSERSATVRADEETQVVRLSVEGYNRLKAEFASTGFKVVDVLLKFMSQRIRRTTTKAAELAKAGKRRKAGGKK